MYPKNYLFLHVFVFCFVIKELIWKWSEVVDEAEFPEIRKLT